MYEGIDPGLYEDDALDELLEAEPESVLTNANSQLVPFDIQSSNGQHADGVNATLAMGGLSEHTRRAYTRWIRKYISDVNGVPLRSIDLNDLSASLVVSSFGAASLKAWLGVLKSHKLGKQSIMQAKAAIVWLAQFIADLGQVEYDIPAGLSRVKAPRAEAGQRAGTWLTQDELKQLLKGVRGSSSTKGAITVRNTAIVTLMVTCGLRRDEIAGALWSDFSRQGRNIVLKVHGKGEKMRVVKLPEMTIAALESWRKIHPEPEGKTAIFTRIWKNGQITRMGITDRAVWMVIDKAARASGLPRISPHDLRRSFARGAYEAGVSFELIRQSLGHSSIATTERYVNSVLELDRAATDIWAGMLDVNEDGE